MALLALSSVASAAIEDAEWTFQGNLDVTGTIPKPAPTPKVVNSTSGEIQPTFIDTNKKMGDKVGEYYLTEDLGKALTLTGSDRMTVGGNTYWGNNTLTAGTGAINSFTLSAWVNFASVDGEQMFFGTGSNNTVGIAMVVKDGQLDLLLKGVDHKYFSTTDLVSAEAWTNLAITYDMETDLAVGYINGEEIGSVDLSKTTSQSAGGSGIVFGSGCFDIKQGGFNGSIADFQILNGALDQAGVLAAAHLSENPVVPEPTTGTLSLLALAGLCIRRRK